MDQRNSIRIILKHMITDSTITPALVKKQPRALLSIFSGQE